MLSQARHLCTTTAGRGGGGIRHGVFSKSKNKKLATKRVLSNNYYFYLKETLSSNLIEIDEYEYEYLCIYKLIKNKILIWTTHVCRT